MSSENKVSTGISGLDEVIDMLRVGDNVVWQVQTIEDYRKVVSPAIKKARLEERKVVYFRYGSHEPLLSEGEATVVYEMDPSEGFESFTTKIHALIEKVGLGALYIFDNLTDLLEYWYSDLMVGNFFKATCPLLYKHEAVAYFALIRGSHSSNALARIRETTEVLLNIYYLNEKTYIHPLKVLGRSSSTMFFPHLIVGEEAVSITSSGDTTALFSGIDQNMRPLDYWELTLDSAREALAKDEATETQMKQLLISLIIGKDEHITKLAERYLSLQDLLNITSREIGTGFVGGKSVGMLLGRKILETTATEEIKDHWESHDSYYLGSDIYYTYLIQNNWWDLRTKQKKPEHFFGLGPELHEKMLGGEFPKIIKEQFVQMLEYFGQSPLVVRSSSLLEDSFGNSFAGKYESVFCANQGSPDERYEAFEQAVRTVFASTVSKEALAYRKDRGLIGTDEQMAILVQRVSGDHYGDLFFPHVAGTGNSSNLYAWEKGMDPSAGMLRLVVGMGTRVVNRTAGDYAKLVPLDFLTVSPPVLHGDELQFSQHKADVLNLATNALEERPIQEIQSMDIKTDKSLFFSRDMATLTRFKDEGKSTREVPQVTDFKMLLTRTDFPALARTALSTLEANYGYPVEIEFTVNCGSDDVFWFNLLQCRPLQTKGFGPAVTVPEPNKEYLFFSSQGNFMGGNTRLPIEYVVFVKPEEYLELSERDKYLIARVIGSLNQQLKNNNVLLIGPGRWGTTTPSLGVPVHFSEMSNMAAICEVAYQSAGLMPELSFGSHFFHDMVESGIFYAAIFDGSEGVTFYPERVLDCDNLLDEFLPEEREWEDIVHVASTTGLTLYSDISTQKVLCFG